MSAYNDDYRRHGYDTVLDTSVVSATERERMSSTNISQSRKKSIIGVAVLPIIDKAQQDDVVEQKDDLTTSPNPKRSQTRKVSMTLKSYQRRLAAAAILGTTIALGGLGLGKAAINKYKESAVMSVYYKTFDSEVIRPERHPTLDHKNYYYDYSDIAQKVMSYDNIDQAVYLLVFSIGEYQADRVLGCTPYHSLDSFLEQRGYEDCDDLRSQAREMIMLEDEINKKQQELAGMREEHADYEFEHSKGEVEDMFTDPVLYDSSDVVTYSGGVKQ